RTSLYCPRVARLPPLPATPQRRATSSRLLDPSDDEPVARFRHDGDVADPEVEHAAQLLLGDVASEPVEDRGSLPGVPVDAGPEALRQDARQVAEDAPTGDVRECVHVSAFAECPDLLQIEARRGEQVL